MHYLTILVSTRCQKLSNLFVTAPGLLKKKNVKKMNEMREWPVSRTLTLNMIRMNFKVAIKADDYV